MTKTLLILCALTLTTSAYAVEYSCEKMVTYKNTGTTYTVTYTSDAFTPTENPNTARFVYLIKGTAGGGNSGFWLCDNQSNVCARSSGSPALDLQLESNEYLVKLSCSKWIP